MDESDDLGDGDSSAKDESDDLVDSSSLMDGGS